MFRNDSLVEGAFSFSETSASIVLMVSVRWLDEESLAPVQKFSELEKIISANWGLGSCEDLFQRDQRGKGGRPSH
jgi:hypothetical protein